jgi:hypothetical protein
MTFGQIKSNIEYRLIESYKNEKEFKKILKEFKETVLTNKTFAELFSLYDDLSKPQGLSEEDANEFVNEGITLIKELLSSAKLPKVVKNLTENKYTLIDNLVYARKNNLVERVVNKKKLVKTISESKTELTESVKLPLNSMVKIANQTLNTYIQNLDESSKKELMNILKEDVSTLESKFVSLQETAKEKLTAILEKESDIKTKSTLSETISKIKSEKFDHLNYFRLKTLVESI